MIEEDEIRAAIRAQHVYAEPAEAILSCVKLVLNTKGVFSVVIDQIERENMSKFLDNVEASLYDEIMETFDNFNKYAREILNRVSTEEA